MFTPIEFMEACRARYGDTFTVRFAGFPPMVMLSDPAVVKEIFTGDPDQLHAGQANAILKPILGASSMLLIDGKRHRDERKLMMPAFHGERMQAYGEAMREITVATIESWTARHPAGKAFPLHTEMQHITLEVILRTVFGLEEGAAKAQLADELRRMLAFGEHPSLLFLINQHGDVRWRRLQERLGRYSPWSLFQRTIDRVNTSLLDEIRRRRARGTGGDDVLSMLLSARDEAGQGMSDEALCDEMKTLLVAGHETTATALTWIMLCLLQHPEAQQRLRAELAQGSLDYLDAVIKEGLRLHPIVPVVGRLLTSPLRVGGREYPAGVLLMPSIYLTHRRASEWPEPTRFRPERFLGKKVSPYEFFPFGGGTRRCIGMAFALYEMRTVLRELVTRATLDLSPGYRPRMERRGITFAVKRGLPVVRRPS